MRRLKAALALSLTLLLVACGGSDDKPGLLTGSSEDKPVTGGGAVAVTDTISGPWLALLDAMPDTADNRSYLEMNDYEALRKLFNAEVPKTPAEVDAYRRKILIPPNGASPVRFSGLGRDFAPNEWLAELGFHPGQVDADLSAGKPPNSIEALRGRFDAAAIETAIDKDTSVVRPTLTKTTREGAPLYIWGEDHKVDPQNRSPVRSLGRGGRMAVKGDLLLWAHATAPVSDAIDAAAGKKPSLADSADVKALLAAMSRHSVYSIVLSNVAITPETLDVVGADPAVVRAARDASFKEALRPYSMLAIGYGQDAEGPFSVLVLLHASGTLAGENLLKLKAKIDTGRSAQTQRAWKDQIGGYEIITDGRALVAKLRTNSRTLLTAVLNTRDSLLVQE
jgi:hypothetical protein